MPRFKLPAVVLPFCLLLLGQSVCTGRAVAQDSLSGSNFGNILPQSGFGQGPFHAAMPFTDAVSPSPVSPADSFNDPSNNFELGGMSQSRSSEPVPQLGLDRPRAWYKFLEPSLNLSKILEESERKHLLSVVPVPLNIRPVAPKTDGRIVLLKADNSNTYFCFKTIYGSLFARSNALLFAQFGKTVRVLNLNGKEKDVLFELPNAQVIAIGPGSEVVISKTLSPQDLNAQDNIARRGITQAVKCSELQISFAQFSYASVMELPELKHFCKFQKPDYIDSLKATINQINEIRGSSGFRTAMLNSAKPAAKKQNTIKAIELAAKSKEAQKKTEQKTDLASIEKTQASKKLEPSAKVNEEKLAAVSIKSKEKGSSRAIVASAGSLFKNKDKKPKPAELKKAPKPETQILESEHLSSEQHDLPARKETVLSSSAGIQKQKAHEGSRTRAVKPILTADMKSKIMPISSFGKKMKEGISKKLAAQPESKSSQTKAGSKPVTVAEPASSETARLLLPRKLPGPNTPPDIAQLLLEADKEEKACNSLRKKADKCIAFLDSGLMNPEQQRRMMVQAKEHLKLAAEAEERAQALRRRAEIAETGRTSL